MKRLREFLLLPAADKWLLIRATFLLETIKLGMWLLPFRTLRSLLTQAACVSRKPQHRDHASAERIAWAVDAAGRHTPGLKTCLVRSLAAQVLLTWHGHPAFLHLGVVRGKQGQFQAHAWVESEGKIVIGGSELERYTLLATLE
jgi:Transglutaminase-like superfamily